MSKLDDILDRLKETDDRLVADVKADITDLMSEIVTSSYDETSKGNFMPLASSYKAIDWIKTILFQKVSKL